MDSWCSPIRAKTGAVVSGGAARNVRISAAGGMDAIIDRVARDAARSALEYVEAAMHKPSAKPKLRLVS